MKGKVNIQEALYEAGAKEIRYDSPRYRFHIEKGSKVWHLEVKWEDHSTLPSFFLGAEHCIRHRPHISWDRNICYSDGEGIFFDHERLNDVLKGALTKAIQVVEDGDAGDLEPFWDELEGYFNSVGPETIRRIAYCYLDLEHTPRKLEAFSGKNQHIKFFDDTAQCWTLDIADYQNALIGKDHRRKKGQKNRKQKPKRPQCYSPVAYYLPLEAPVDPPLPGQTWSIEKVLALVEPFTSTLPELNNYLKKNHQRYLFSIPRPGKDRGTFAVEVNPRQALQTQIFYYRVIRHTKNYLQKRAGVPKSLGLNSHKIAIIGCGAVGSHLACMLAQNGFNQMTLVDDDLFLADNCYRHALSKRYIGQKKVAALKHYLEDRFLDMEVTPVSEKAQSWAIRNNLEDHDVLVLATGNPALERYLNQLFRSVARPDQVLLSSWLEPLGLGGHIVLHAANSKGCLNCLYTKENELVFHPVVSFIEEGQKVTRNLTGCGGAFTPFSALDAQETAILAARALTSYYSGKRMSAYNCWFGEKEASERNGIIPSDVYNTRFKNKDSWWGQKLRTGCPVCRDRQA